MATFNKFDQFVQDLANKVHNLHSDTLMVMLTNTLPVRANAVKADITEIGAGNGYAAGGAAATLASDGQAAGLYKLVLNDVSWTAVTGNIGPFRWAVLYNATPTSPLKPLIGWFDYGSVVTLLPGEPFVWDANASTGVLTIQ